MICRIEKQLNQKISELNQKTFILLDKLFNILPVIKMAVNHISVHL